MRDVKLRGSLKGSIRSMDRNPYEQFCSKAKRVCLFSAAKHASGAAGAGINVLNGLANGDTGQQLGSVT